MVMSSMTMTERYRSRFWQKMTERKALRNMMQLQESLKHFFFKSKLFFGILRPTQTQASKCGNTFAIATVTYIFQLKITVLACNPRTHGYRKESTFSALIVDLAGTGDQTQAA
jgi:hypothetical protein